MFPTHAMSVSASEQKEEEEKTRNVLYDLEVSDIVLYVERSHNLQS